MPSTSIEPTQPSTGIEPAILKCLARRSEQQSYVTETAKLFQFMFHNIKDWKRLTH